MNPKPYGVNELREMFLSFFESKGNSRLESVSIIVIFAVVSLRSQVATHFARCV